ncbi:MAG: hypothetical protein WA773_07075, partial [Bradyrhizobium sp.]
KKSRRDRLGAPAKPRELFGGVVQRSRFVRKNREVLRLLAVSDFQKSFGGHAALEQFPYGRCPARHPLGKTPGIDDPQFCVGQHDLEPFASIEFAHLTLP